MIKINNIEVKILEKEIQYGNFEVKDGKDIRKGTSPVLSFLTEKKQIIEIETTLSQDITDKMKDNTRININKYITDINYEDQDGWLSLMTGEFKVDFKKEKENYKIFLLVEDKSEQIKIEIEEVVEL